MKIAIVDDEQDQRATLRAFLRDFEKEFHREIIITEYDRAYKLLEADYSAYDIAILDIEMEGMSGMEVAHEIRKKDSKLIIIFVTNMAQYAIEGYAVDAVDYMLKPVRYSDFSMKFQKALRHYARRQDSFIMIEAADGLRRIGIESLYYIEVLGHYLIYHTENREYKVRGSMAFCEAEMKKFSFARSHKSFLVNQAKISNITSSSVFMGDRSAPIGKTYKESFMQGYLAYCRGEL